MSSPPHPPFYFYVLLCSPWGRLPSSVEVLGYLLLSRGCHGSMAPYA